MVTPHALFLAMHHEPRQAYDNLRQAAARTLDAYGEGGFYDAIAVGPGPIVAQRYLSLDQAMVMGSIGNVFGGDIVRRAVLCRGHPPHHPAVDRAGGVRRRARSETPRAGGMITVAGPDAVARPHLRGATGSSSGEIHRPIEVVRCAGGKPLNLARAAATLGADVEVVAVLGGPTGQILADAAGRGRSRDHRVPDARRDPDLRLDRRRGHRRR